MSEDKTAARKLVEADAKGMAQALAKLHRETGTSTDIVPVDEDGNLPADIPDGDGDGLLIHLTIGSRDKLSKQEARSSAALWRNTKQRYPKAIIAIHFLGYDQDPREIWEFPEVCRFIRWWARAAGLDNEAAALATEDPLLCNLLAASGVFGEAMRQEFLRINRSTERN